jgi:hypothetical protein
VKHLGLLDALKLVFPSTSASSHVSLSPLRLGMVILLFCLTTYLRVVSSLIFFAGSKNYQIAEDLWFFCWYSVFLSYCSSDVRNITLGASTLSVPFILLWE